MALMRKRGFTLVELLLVIAVIGLLAGLIAVNLNKARIKSRDAKRRSDLNQIKTAVEMYFDDNKSYLIAGTGQGTPPNSTGFFNCSGTITIAQGLINGGYLSSEPKDPSATCGVSSYMYYAPTAGFTQGYGIYAHLENPTNLQNGWDGASGSNCRDATKFPVATTIGPGTSNYDMNYCVNS